MSAFLQRDSQWTPPLDDELIFSEANCQAAAQWYWAWLNAKAHENPDSGDAKSHVAAGLIIAYLTSLIPKNYTQKRTRSDILLWYEDMSDTLFSQLLEFPYKHCETPICRNIAWPGDPDITGVGMMISYCIAAIFATIYFVVITVAELGALWRKRKQKHDRFVYGFTESANTFLDSALLFALSMLVAATARYAQVLRDPIHGSMYALLSSMYMSLFSVFPALTLQSVASGLRRQWLRLCLWLLVIIFVITVGILYIMVFEKESWESTPTRPVWLQMCDDQTLRHHLKQTIITGHVFLGIYALWGLYYVLGSLAPEKWKPKIGIDSRLKRWLRICHPYRRFIVGLVEVSLMWTFLALFVEYRAKVADAARRGYADNEWTFGQVLALTTWAPVIVDLVSIYSLGAEEGLGSKLSKRYKVIAIPFLVQRHRRGQELSHVDDGADSSNLLNEVEDH
ncbi:hypothetical protein GQ53DRAFT_820258 [Thozetella sp. PMI_491]|nr:hypothetical protein GQ53DRAFT_820258 [Thozetella sp. PMI_491]